MVQGWSVQAVALQHGALQRLFSLRYCCAVFWLSVSLLSWLPLLSLSLSLLLLRSSRGLGPFLGFVRARAG